MDEQAILALWQKVRDIYLVTAANGTEKSKAERNFAQVEHIEQDGNKIKIALSSLLTKDYFENEIADKIKMAMKLAGVDDNLTLEYQVVEPDVTPLVRPVEPKEAYRQIKSNQNLSSLPLKKEYTFEEFVVGPSNSWAYACAKGVAQNPGSKEYNPLFIHGGTGLGKTHLMQAIGNAILEHNKNIRLCYVSAETFMNEYYNSIVKHTQDQFRDKYRSMDVLLVDDVQFMTTKENFQEEFFNTFNVLQNAGKQIVMTSDVSPKNLPLIQPRLISRFEGGMVQPIDKPNCETRLAILHKKSEHFKNKIPEFALNFIAQNINSHVRAIEGALSRVKIMVDNDPDYAKNLTNEILHSQLVDLIEKEKKISSRTCEEIIDAVRKKFNLSLEQMTSPDRPQELVTPRQLAMYIAVNFTSMSVKAIAKKFEKSHATVLHGNTRIKNRIDVEPKLRDSLNEILESLGLTMGDINQ